MTTIDKISHHVRSHLNSTLRTVETPTPDRRGKVRDIYERDRELFFVCTDRVSAFDVVLGTLPLKGALLTEQTSFWFDHVSGVIPHHYIERVDEQVMRCKRATPIPFEIVVRGYLAGSLMREPAETRGSQYGLLLDPAQKPYEAFDEPIITPTTKAPLGGHDLPLSLDAMKSQLSARQVDHLCMLSKTLFRLGQRFALEQGLILVDTKYEFGLIGDEIILIDEVHTADSSRFWLQSSYAGKLRDGLAPDMLDKEVLRTALIARGFNAEDTPTKYLDDELRARVACEYWRLTEALLGKAFEAPEEPSAIRVPKRLACLLG